MREKLRNAKLTVKVVSDKDIQVDKQDLVNSVIQSLANYQESAKHKDTIILPVLSIYRIDLNETKDIAVPLSGTNKFRNSIGLLSTKQIMENYDKEIQKLTLSELLKTKATKVIKSEEVFAKFPNAVLLDISLSKTEIDSFKSAIYDSLFALKSNAAVVFYLTNSKANKPLPPIPAGIYQKRDTCDHTAHISYQVVSDGNGGFKFGDKIKDNSIECGYVPPTVALPIIVKKTIHPQQPVKLKRINNSTDKKDVDPFKLSDPSKPQQIDKKLLKPNQKN